MGVRLKYNFENQLPNLLFFHVDENAEEQTPLLLNALFFRRKMTYWYAKFILL